MRRKLIVRFLLAYILITVCIQVLPGSVWYLLKELGVPRYAVSHNLGGILREFLAYAMQSSSALLIAPGTDAGALAGMLVSASVLVAGAVLFARGPVKEYHNLCEKADMLAADTTAPGTGEKEDLEVERRLEAIAARMTDAKNALRTQRACAEETAMLLDAACTQIEVLVEAGSLAQGSAEAALVQDAITKIKRASSQLLG